MMAYNVMKTFLKLMGILAVAVIFAFSCSKAGSVYDGTSWYGRTGAESSLTLTFNDNAQKCMVLESTGECGLGFEFEVEWTSRNSFKLQITEEGHAHVYYSGVINGEFMTLENLRHQTEDLRKHTYELRKTH